MSLQQNNDSASKRNYYFPKKENMLFDKRGIEKWYQNLLSEISQNNYPVWALNLLKDKRNYYGKYLNPKSREFFLNHFAKNLVETIGFLVNNSALNCKILEIGCGCGNQLLLMALLGAEVSGCDIRQDVCNLVNKRKEFYEGISGRRLHISLICEDVFKVDWSAAGQFDALNFLFSFNDLRPNKRILDLVVKLLKPGGRVVFQETNPANYYNRVFRRRDSMTPRQVVETLKKYNFEIHSLRGGYALPPIFWQFLPRSILTPVDDVLCNSLFLSPSYHLMAEKR